MNDYELKGNSEQFFDGIMLKCGKGQIDDETRKTVENSKWGKVLIDSKLLFIYESNNDKTEIKENSLNIDYKVSKRGRKRK